MSTASFPVPAPLAQAALLCFSHLRWNFVFQRPQHLLSRAAQTYAVYFFEEPRFADHAVPHLERHRSPEGVTVCVPVLPTGTRPTEVTRAQRKLVVELLADLQPQHLVLWYYTPMALTFSRHL